MVGKKELPKIKCQTGCHSVLSPICAQVTSACPIENLSKNNMKLFLNQCELKSFLCQFREKHSKCHFRHNILPTESCGVRFK